MKATADFGNSTEEHQGVWCNMPTLTAVAEDVSHPNAKWTNPLLKALMELAMLHLWQMISFKHSREHGLICIFSKSHCRFAQGCGLGALLKSRKKMRRHLRIIIRGKNVAGQFQLAWDQKYHAHYNSLFRRDNVMVQSLQFTKTHQTVLVGSNHVDCAEHDKH